MDGWIKLHRSMTEWEWYQDINTKVLFIHLLLKANTKDKLWKGNFVQRGQLISSYTHLSDETGLTVAQVRRCLENLKSTGEITHVNCYKYGLFTVVNYDKYQFNDSPEHTQTARLQQADNTQSATTKKKKNNKKDKNEYIPEFEEFWKAYPRKTEKAACYEKYCARLKDGVSEVELLTAAKKYADQCHAEKTLAKYIKHGATFLSNKEPFRDYLSKDEYAKDSTEYRLAKFFEKFRQGIDEKYVISNIQDVCKLFSDLLKDGRNPNEIWSVMNALFTGSNDFLIKKYMDINRFCRDFSDIGSQLMLEK